MCTTYRVTQVQTDEYGVEETVTVLQPAPLEKYSKQDVFVPPVLAKWLRPHQREGVHFMYQCVMGLKDYDGNGVILADDMGKHEPLVFFFNFIPLYMFLSHITLFVLIPRTGKNSSVCNIDLYFIENRHHC